MASGFLGQVQSVQARSNAWTLTITCPSYYSEDEWASEWQDRLNAERIVASRFSRRLGRHRCLAVLGAFAADPAVLIGGLLAVRSNRRYSRRHSCLFDRPWRAVRCTKNRSWCERHEPQGWRLRPSPSSAQSSVSPLRRRVKERDLWRCERCGGSEKLHVHHRRQVAHGGTHRERNVTTLCAMPCDDSSASMTVTLTIMSDFQDLLLELPTGVAIVRMQDRRVTLVTWLPTNQITRSTRDSPSTARSPTFRRRAASEASRSGRYRAAVGRSPRDAPPRRWPRHSCAERPRTARAK